MKLSEKLAALEEEETPRAPRPRRRRRRAGAAEARPAPRKSRAAPRTWDATKRKVRELVLDEVAPKMQGLAGEELAAEVKTRARPASSSARTCRSRRSSGAGSSRR